MRAMPMSNIYLRVELSVMTESVMLMRDGAVKSRALFTQWNYLPQLHNQFRDLVLSVSESSSVLSEVALSTKMTLEKQISRLDSLDHELSGTSDEQDIDEIRADRVALLAEMGAQMGIRTGQLSDQLSTLNNTFNQRLTQGYIGDLEKDQLKAEAVIEHLSAERVERQNERSVITEAIDALAKGGIEKIGNDVALTLEKVVSLGIAPPKVQLVMFAIEQLKKTIEQIGEGIRFLDMVRERDTLVAKIEALGCAVDMKQDELTSLKGKVEFIRVIHTIDDQRQRYVGEYRRVIETFQLFAAQIDVGLQAEVLHFIRFLSPLSLPLVIR